MRYSIPYAITSDELDKWGRNGPVYRIDPQTRRRVRIDDVEAATVKCMLPGCPRMAEPGSNRCLPCTRST